MPRRPVLIVSSLAVAVVLVGCGGDGDPSAVTGPTAEDSTTAAETTEVSDDETTTTASGSGGGEGDEEFCAAYATFEEATSDLPNETLEDLHLASGALLRFTRDVAEVAPDELTEDMDVLVDAVERYTDDLTAATTVEEGRRIAGRLFDEDYLAPATRVGTYEDEHCP